MTVIDRLLVVDPVCNQRAPTMRSWLGAAAEVLPKHFKKVEIWSMENQLDEPWVVFRKFAKISPFWPIQSAFFRHSAWAAYKKLTREERERTLIQCSGEHLPVADIRYMHFWNIAFATAARRKPKELRSGLKETLIQEMAISSEKRILDRGNTGEWWCVSRGISEPIQSTAKDGSVFKILPNSYDPERFNPHTRQIHRDSMRKSYGFAPDETILVFCSFGHFVRKGLPLAIHTIQKLRASGIKVRLLVLGGTEGTLASFRKEMERRNLSSDGVVFAGLVSPPEFHLSAADALFFPSHFEAFSLVEIEAAALGLRLYLTPHPGSEMILREGINGRVLPWDADGMAAVLIEEIISGAINQPHDEIGEALTPHDFAIRLDQLYGDAISRKEQRMEVLDQRKS